MTQSKGPAEQFSNIFSSCRSGSCLRLWHEQKALCQKGHKSRKCIQPSHAEKAASDKHNSLPVSEEERRRKLWYLAVKPPMYSVGIIPVLVGAAAAYCETGVKALGRTGYLLLGSIFIIAWLNLSNDAFDAAMGVDKDKAESVVNLTQNRLGVLWTANVFLVAGAALLWQVISRMNDVRVGVMLSAAIALGYMYQGPPFRLSFKGLGEPITFITFGPLATSSFYLAQVATNGATRPLVSAHAAVASVLVGLTTATILFCSHFHQMAGDKAAGKKSPIVRLGSTTRALRVLQWIVAGTYVLALAAILRGGLPWTSALLFPCSVPLARGMLQFCSDNHKTAARVRPLKLYAVKWHTSMGLSIAAGLILYRYFILA